MTHTPLMNKFITVSPISPVYPPCLALKDISKSPRNNNALPVIAVKKSPKVWSRNKPIAEINKQGVIHKRSGMGKDRSKAK